MMFEEGHFRHNVRNKITKILKNLHEISLISSLFLFLLECTKYMLRVPTLTLDRL